MSRGKDVLEEDTIAKDDNMLEEYKDEYAIALRQTRKSEKGLITHNKTISIALVFQGNPIWLLALDPNYVDMIFMVEFGSFQNWLNI